MTRIRSMYSVTFNNQSRCWEKSRKYNVKFLQSQQHYANDLMRRRYYATPKDGTLMRGYVFLNEVFAMLAMPLTPIGACVGWVYDENNPIGDNFVDFQINIQGTNPNVILDFNVDGNISDQIFLK